MPRESHVGEDVLALLSGKYSDGATAEELAEEIGAHLVWTQTVCRQFLRSYSVIRYQQFTPGEEHLGRWRYYYLINDPERQRIRRERQLAFLDKVRANERAAAQRKRERVKDKAKKKAATKAVAKKKGIEERLERASLLSGRRRICRDPRRRPQL